MSTNRLRCFLSLVVFAVVVHVVARPARGQYTLYIKNTGDQEVDLAIAKSERGKDWLVEGWYGLPPGKKLAFGNRPGQSPLWCIAVQQKNKDGEWGYANYAPRGREEFRKWGDNMGWSKAPTNHEFVVDKEPFTYRGTSEQNAQWAKENPALVLAPFYIFVSGGEQGQSTLEIPTSANAPITVLKKVDPNAPWTPVAPPKRTDDNAFVATLIDGRVVTHWGTAAQGHFKGWFDEKGTPLGEFPVVLRPQREFPPTDPRVAQHVEAITGAFKAPPNISAEDVRVTLRTFELDEYGVVTFRYASKDKEGTTIGIYRAVAAHLDFDRAVAVPTFWQKGTGYALEVPGKKSPVARNADAKTMHDPYTSADEPLRIHANDRREGNLILAALREIAQQYKGQEDVFTVKQRREMAAGRTTGGNSGGGAAQATSGGDTFTPDQVPSRNYDNVWLAYRIDGRVMSSWGTNATGTYAGWHDEKYKKLAQDMIVARPEPEFPPTDRRVAGQVKTITDVLAAPPAISFNDQRVSLRTFDLDEYGVVTFRDAQKSPKGTHIAIYRAVVAKLDFEKAVFRAFGGGGEGRTLEIPGRDRSVGSVRDAQTMQDPYNTSAGPLRVHVNTRAEGETVLAALKELAGQYKPKYASHTVKEVAEKERAAKAARKQR